MLRAKANTARGQLDGLVTLALEWPLPFVKQTKVYESIKFRLGLYTWAAFVAGACAEKSTFRLLRLSLDRG